MTGKVPEKVTNVLTEVNYVVTEQNEGGKVVKKGFTDNPEVITELKGLFTLIKNGNTEPPYPITEPNQLGTELNNRFTEVKREAGKQRM